MQPLFPTISLYLFSPHLDRAKITFLSLDMVEFREVRDRSGLSNLRKMLQPLHQDLPLKLLIKRITHGVAQRKSHQQSSRRLHTFGNRTVKRYGNGRNPLCLDGPLDQSHGLIAGPSGRRQEHGINPICFQHPCHFRACPIYKHFDMAAEDMAHE